MLRNVVRRNSLKGLRGRGLATPSAPPNAPKQAAAASTKPAATAVPVPNKGGSSFPLLVLAAFGGLGYAAYEAEVDSAFNAQVKQVPGANYLLFPFRTAISLTGLVTKPTAPEFAPKIEDVEALSSSSEEVHTTLPSDSKLNADENAAVISVEQETPNAESTVEQSTEPDQSTESPGEDASIAAEENIANAQAGAAAAVHAVASKAEEAASAPAAAAADSSSVKVSSVKLYGVSAEEAARLTDSKVLKQALADSAREYIALRRDVESTLLKDIHQLNEHDLRIRIKQLATEMFERLAWEDLRMNQSLKGVQAELTEKYTDLMHRQQRELELEVARIIFAFEQEAAHKSAEKLKQVEATYQKQLEDTVRAQAEGFHATMRRELEEQAEKIHTELQDQANHEVALLRKSQVDELMALQPQIQEVFSQLQGVQRAADATAGVIKKTIDIHHLSAAVLSLELALSTPPAAFSNDNSSNAIGQHLSAVRTSCQGDEVVTAVLDSLPERVATSGALPLSELQVRFGVMRDEVRKAALAPEAAPKMIGQLIGTVLAAISIAPNGLVSGHGAEETLSRAAYYLERGRLTETLRELDAVEGYAQVLMQDWKALARERLIVDQSVRVLKANAVIRHKAFK